jgi:hypothetical protein
MIFFIFKLLILIYSYIFTTHKNNPIYPSGKEWGDPQGFPWLGIHGWLDNSGTKL